MKWPPYPKYKDSGVEWLRDMPERWKIKRGRFLFQLNPPHFTAPLSNSKFVSFVPMEAVETDGSIDVADARVIEDIGSGYTAFQDGDVIFAKITPCFENGKGALAHNLINERAYGSTEFHVLRVRNNLSNIFLYYVTKSTAFMKLGESEMYGAGGQKRVPAKFCLNFRFPFPSLKEQQAIATFLDKETGRIDALVAKKKALIEKLKEQRTAIISNAVTKGLPDDVAPRYGLKPYTRFKLSGVDWLGDVPEGWEVKRLKEIVKEPLSYGANASSEESNSYEPRYIRITDISPDGSLCPDSYRSLPMETAKPYLLRDGDILLARSGATVGKSFLYKESYGQCCFAGYLIRVRVNKKIASSNFIIFIMQSIAYWQYIASIQIQATIQNVSAEKYNELLIPLPSLKEQQAIADYLDEQTGKIDVLIAKLEQAITTLQEYRTALITAAVTGKIDVRHEAGMQEIS